MGCKIESLQILDLRRLVGMPQGVIDREQNAVADSLLDDFKNKDSQSLKTTIKWFFMLLFMKVFFL